jgi:hypothetical protein
VKLRKLSKEGIVATDVDGISRTDDRDLVYRSSQLLVRREKRVCILVWYLEVKIDNRLE